MGRGWLAIAGLLAACGGGGVAVVAVQTPAGQPAPAASAPAAPAASSPASAWSVLWGDSWADLAVGGTINPAPITCRDESDPPDSFMGQVAPAQGARWAVFGHPAPAAYALAGGRLQVDSLQTRSTGGWALIGAQALDATKPLRLQTTIDLHPDPGAWISAPLLADEGDYRQISLRAVGDRIHADLGAPCYWAPLASYAPGPRAVMLEYTPPPADVCWRYYVDGLLLAEERCNHKGAALRNNPRAAVYVVNVGVESGSQEQGRVRATVGPITVSGL